MNWQQVCSDPKFQNLPYKIELNAKGQLIMSPAKLYHGRFQSKIGFLLQSLLTHGEVITECAILTSDSTKVADVAWFSEKRWKEVQDDFEASIAPELCVEIVSYSNTQKELMAKKRLYFQAGAQEFWLCDQQGQLQFWSTRRKLKKSHLVPDFPSHLE